MNQLLVPIYVNGNEDVLRETIYTVDDFPFSDFQTLRECRKRGRKKNPITYYDVEMAFDIETTTLEKLDYERYNKTGEKVVKGTAFLYQWQFCIKDTVCFGRTWNEFLSFCEKLHLYLKTSDKKRAVVYVHNLSYEFQFMKDFVEFDEIFARDAHKVMKCYSHRYGIEFRCSYFLSNMSMAKFCENSEGVFHYKLVDTYDYKKLRTPSTVLTEIEKSYCYNDVRGLCECIRALRKEDNLAEIPLTSTGYVRREFRRAMQADKGYYPEIFHDLALNLSQYRLCKDAFRGGNTHANRVHAGHTITAKKGENAIVMGSMDISSSYPAQIAMGYYPMSAFTEVKITAQSQFDNLCDSRCVIMRVQFDNLHIKENIPVPYIPLSKCQKHGKECVIDNGRVLSIDCCEIAMTEIDLEIIRNQYEYDFFTVSECYVAARGKLPDSMRNTMMSFFIAKSKLKENPDKVYEYMKSKNKLNSTFGMCVTDLLQDEWVMNQTTGEWSREKADAEKALNTYYESKNSFLHYQWGIYVTAHARKQLQDMLDVVGMDAVYCDTDSIKFLQPEVHIPEFEAKNKLLSKRAIENDIPAFCDVGEKRYILGVWDMDDLYIQFKTLGAKKYCGVEWDEKAAQSGKDPVRFTSTVAGMNKKLGAENLKCCNNFRLCRRMENVGRTISCFNNSKPHYIKVNGEEILTASNIGIIDTTYTLGVSNEYYEVLVNSQDGVLPE
jgi:hypothetical protein